MQFEIDLNICSDAIYEMKKIEQKLHNEYSKLFEVYRFFSLSEDDSERILAKRIKKELASIENELQKIKIFRKSLEKIQTLYKNSEKTIYDELDSTSPRFQQLIDPISVMPIDIKKFFVNLGVNTYLDNKHGG